MIHPTAVIDPTAHIEDGVTIGAYATIGANVSIASGTVVGPHVVIQGPTKIGQNNHFFQFSSIGEAPQDLKFDGEETYLEIGDRNTIREFCTLNRGTSFGGHYTKIGNDNLIMAYCHIAHDCILGNHIVMTNNTALAGHVVVEDHVKLGGYTLVHQFSKLGYSSFTGMAAVINKDVTPYTLVSGNYAKAIGINKIGLKRSGMDDAIIRALHTAFRKLLYSKKSQEQALSEVAGLAEEYPEVKRFVEFIENSERGVVRSK